MVLINVFLQWHKWEILHDIVLRLQEHFKWLLLQILTKLYFLLHFIIFYKEISNFKLCLYYLIKCRFVVFLLQWDLDFKNQLQQLMKVNLDMFLLLTELVLLILVLKIYKIGISIFWHIKIFVDMDLLNWVLWIQILKILFIIKLLLVILLKELNMLILLLYVLYNKVK